MFHSSCEASCEAPSQGGQVSRSFESYLAHLLLLSLKDHRSVMHIWTSDSCVTCLHMEPLKPASSHYHRMFLIPNEVEKVLRPRQYVYIRRLYADLEIAYQREENIGTYFEASRNALTRGEGFPSA